MNNKKISYGKIYRLKEEHRHLYGVPDYIVPCRLVNVDGVPSMYYEYLMMRDGRSLLGNYDLEGYYEIVREE